MYTVLFVCTGNTCRSPMAQAILTDMVCKDNLQTRVQVESAGLSARDGDMAAIETENAIQRRGVKPLQHRARRIENILLQKADLVLTMTDSHRRELVQRFPEATARTHLLGEFAGSPGDVPDPIGGGPSAYDRCAISLQQLIGEAWPRIRQLAGINRAEGELHMKLVIGSDHGGFELKEAMGKHLCDKQIEYTDLGVFSGESADYPDVAFRLAEAVSHGEYDKGLLFCGTGVGVSIAANKVKGIRAANCHDVFSAKMSREHNDANILTLGGRVIGAGLAAEIIDAWLASEFVGDRHARRIGKIGCYEQGR